MDRIFVDTNLLIDFSKGRSEVLKRLIQRQQQQKAILIINPVVLAEYYTDQNLKRLANLKKANEFISWFKVVPVTKKIGFTAGKLLRDKRVVFIGDALIAATCLEENLELATHNEKHFKNINNLKFAQF